MLAPAAAPRRAARWVFFFLPRDGAVGSCFDAGDMTTEEERDGGEE